MKLYMNFKKVLSIASVASIAVVGLVSCGGKSGESGNGFNGSINLSLDYKGTAYLTYGRGNDKLPSTYETVDGKKLVKGSSITPIWQDIADNMGVSFKDAALIGNTTAASMELAITAGYKGYQGRQIDMLQIISNDNFTSAVNNGAFVNFEDYKEYLPNLYKWLNTHQGVKDQMYTGTGEAKGIYYTPYFDGVDQVEKGFNMNLEMVEALLDDNADNEFVKADALDTTAADGEFVMTSYIPSLTNQEIAVAGKNGEATSITVSFGKSAIQKQNELATKNGSTLVESLKAHIDEVYGAYIGEDKIYSKRSEIFTSASACYNADDLVALLRCVKYNPNYLTGNADAEMNPIFPRTAEQNRASIMFELSQMFGLRGTNGENGRFWINEAGELVDTITQTYAYDCIEKMMLFQKEGLFPQSEGWVLGSSATTDYRKETLDDGVSFMTYDYLNVAAFNSDVQSKEGWRTSKMQGVLPPVAKWPMTKDNDGNTIVGNVEGQGYSYTRFSEDNRSLKDGGWAICASVASNPKKLKKCLEIVDYLYSEEGSFLECYGVNYKDANGTLDYDKNGNITFKNSMCDEIVTDGDGVRYPKLSAKYVEAIREGGGGTWHNYMTQYLGSCLGVGNIRSNYLESQNTGAQQKVGVEKYATAMGAGAMYLATTAGTNFLRSVNTTVTYTTTQETNITNDAAVLTTWWSITKNKATNRWDSKMLESIHNMAYSDKTRADLVNEFTKYNESKVKATAEAWGLTANYNNQYAFLG